VKLVKSLPDYIARKKPELFLMMKSELKKALEDGRKLIFVDEAMFTTASRMTHAYSNKRSNVIVD
jgi:hypothetical protein